jgi:DNA-binding transcriptional ArsR family regulator
VNTVPARGEVWWCELPYHLAALREAGLVTASPSGRSNRYRLAHADLDELASLLGKLEPMHDAEEATERSAA